MALPPQYSTLWPEMLLEWFVMKLLFGINVLIAGVAILLSGCVVTESSAIQPEESESLSNKSKALPPPTIAREPLPLFHAEYKSEARYASRHTNTTDDNLRNFATLVNRTIRVEILDSSARVEGEPINSSMFEDSTLIEDIHWAFSGKLRETGLPGFSVWAYKIVFHLSDGEMISMKDYGSFWDATFKDSKWEFIVSTDEMREVIQPYIDLHNAKE